VHVAVAVAVKDHVNVNVGCDRWVEQLAGCDR
jgi:hypothetical protein